MLCDTLVALGNSTEDGSVIIAKNSDRDPNECQVIRYFPRSRYPSNSTLRCTYIEIPQAPETFEVVLSAPYWIWGAEMGANEFGVAIGNESAWSKEPYQKNGLLGMDLLRIALERADTAKKALDIITLLLKEYGQGGNASAKEQQTYHNTYIIADPHDAWVLETADRFWVAERVHDVRSISNGYTIKTKWDLASPDLVDHAIEKGWCKSKADFDFSRDYSNPGMRLGTACEERSKRTSDLLMAAKGSVTVETMMNILRDHGEKSDLWSPPKATMGNVCMHASSAAFSSSAGSYVGHLADNVATHWLTGTAYPCVSVFIPVYLSGAGPSRIFSEGGAKYDDRSPWWIHEKLARVVQLDYLKRAPPLKNEIRKLQISFIKEANALRQQTMKQLKSEQKSLREFTERCSKTVYDAIPKWISNFAGIGSNDVAPLSYRNYWSKLNAKANLRL